MKGIGFRLLSVVLIMAIHLCASATVYTLPADGGDVIGQVQHYTSQAGESFTSIARKFNLGYYEIIEANSSIDPTALRVGTELVIPTEFILPKTPREGVVINLAELRLYHYLSDGKHVLTEPVGIGREGWETPLGDTKIVDKRHHPTWTAPQSVIDDMAKRHVVIPHKLPPGPKNPLGDHAMRLQMLGYAIHGTNRPEGVGRRVSAGCVRLYPEGVARFFDQVDVGTPVHFINQPYKVAQKDQQLVLEAHLPLREQRKQLHGQFKSLYKPLIKQVAREYHQKVNWREVSRAVAESKGIPVPIS